MPSCVLYETSLIAEGVSAIFSHTMEMSLVFSVSTMLIFTILVEPRILKLIFQVRKILNLSISQTKKIINAYLYRTYPSGTGSSFNMRIEFCTRAFFAS